MFEVGEVKQNPSEKHLEGIVGMELLLFKSTNENKRCVLGPLYKNDIDKYWEDAFEEMGKDWISKDYKYFLRYMLNENCEITSSIELEELNITRAATKEDIQQLSDTMEWFIEKHQLDI